MFVSIPGAMWSPTISTIFPMGWVRLVGGSVTSASTIWPWVAPPMRSLGMITSWEMRLLSGTTKPTPLSW